MTDSDLTSGVEFTRKEPELGCADSDKSVIEASIKARRKATEYPRWRNDTHERSKL